MLIGASAAIALPNLVLGIWQRRAAHLAFVLAATAVIGIAFAELIMMRAGSAEQFAQAQRWTHVPIFFLVVALVAFVRFYFRTGRLWLGIMACAVRFAALVINFASVPSLNFRAITGVRQISFLGETVSVPIGLISPWTRLGELSSLLLLAFVIDASISLWKTRTTDARRRALVVGGGTIFFILVAAGVTALIHARVIEAPYMVSFPFAAILVAMGCELAVDLFRARQVAKKLQASEASLHDIEDRVSLAAEAAQLGMWVLNPITKELWVSDKVRKLFHFEPERNLTDAELQERVHPDDRAVRESVMQKAINTKEDYETEYRIVLPDGTIRWISGRARCINGNDGKSKRLIGVSMDVTKRKQAEEQARHNREQMELLSRASVLGEMTASLAHELNQPLSAIVSNANAGMRFLDSGKADTQMIHEILQDVVADGHRAYEIIHNVRNTIKKGAAARRLINLNQLVTDVAHMVRPNATAYSCSMETSLADDLPAVEGDPVQIQQVLVNLLTNSFEAMATTEPERRQVLIATERNGTGNILVSVRDNGAGFQNGAAEDMFEHFFTTKEQGLGLGLSIVRSIVESHGGKISAANLPAGGARFSFTLPAKLDPR
jgi:two-component system sensor kinase FixL